MLLPYRSITNQPERTKVPHKWHFSVVNKQQRVLKLFVVLFIGVQLFGRS